MVILTLKLKLNFCKVCVLVRRQKSMVIECHISNIQTAEIQNKVNSLFGSHVDLLCSLGLNIVL